MDRNRKARIMVSLRDYYRQQLEPVSPDTLDSLASRMAAEAARPHTGMSLPAFVAAQALYVPTWVWVAQAALVAVMVIVARSAGDTLAVRWVVGAISSASVLVCVPTIHASRLHGVYELESSCRHGAASALAARLIVLGCSAALSVGLMVFATSAATGLGALRVALWACPPHFLSCAGSLAILRKVRPSSAYLACAAWVTVCCGVLCALGMRFPASYGEASISLWAFASLAALSWLSHEVVLAVRAAAKGLDGLSPQTQVTFN